VDCEAVDEACEAVDKDCDRDVVFVGTRILFVGRKAVSGGDVLSDSCVIVMGRKAVGGEVFAGSEAVDEGRNAVAESCEAVDKDGILANKRGDGIGRGSRVVGS